jgi:hypothetical protein
MWVLLAVLVAALGGAAVATVLDDDDDGPGESAVQLNGTSTTLDDAPQQFEGDTPFTFEYPATFAAVPEDALPAGYIAILGIDPVNFIDVRLTANEELSDEAIVNDIGGALTAPGVEVTDTTTSTADGVTFTVFTVVDTTSGTSTESRLHFFRADGRTWELACQMDEAGRDVVSAACDEMLRTFELS